MNFTAAITLALVCVASASRSGKTKEDDSALSQQYQKMMERRYPAEGGLKKAQAKRAERERRTSEILGMMAARKATGKSLYSAEAMGELKESWKVRKQHARINDTTKDKKLAGEYQKIVAPIMEAALRNYSEAMAAKERAGREAERKAAEELAEYEAAEWDRVIQESITIRQRIADEIEAERAEGIAADEAERRAKREADRKAKGH